jgi:acyl-CoA hydrolase
MGESYQRGAEKKNLTCAQSIVYSIDSLNFIASSGVGDVVTIRSVVSRSFNSSMEVYVSVEAGKVLFLSLTK